MSNKWSSFKKQQMIMENWRKFVNEAELGEPATAPAANAGQGDMDVTLDIEYTKFVQWLGSNISDPKTQALIGAGLKDGDPNDDKFGFSEGGIAVSKLIPTQNEIDINKSLAFPLVKKPSEFIAKVVSDGPFTVVENIVVFNGKYVVDGHHRWSTVYACNKNAQIMATNITIEGIDPLDALKAVQMAIGLQAKKVPMQSVEGTNLLKMSDSDLTGWIKKNVKKDLYAAILAAPKVKQLLTGPAAEQAVAEGNQMELAMLQGGLIKYLWGNIAAMRKTSQPTPGAGPRDFMPQTGGIDWQEPLKQGVVDIVPPHGAKKAAEE